MVVTVLAAEALHLSLPRIVRAVGPICGGVAGVAVGAGGVNGPD
jgi:hypothetical protein